MVRAAKADAQQQPFFRLGDADRERCMCERSNKRFSDAVFSSRLQVHVEGWTLPSRPCATVLTFSLLACIIIHVGVDFSSSSGSLSELSSPPDMTTSALASWVLW